MVLVCIVVVEFVVYFGYMFVFEVGYMVMFVIVFLGVVFFFCCFDIGECLWFFYVFFLFMLFGGVFCVVEDVNDVFGVVDVFIIYLLNMFVISLVIYVIVFVIMFVVVVGSVFVEWWGFVDDYVKFLFGVGFVVFVVMFGYFLWVGFIGV